MCSNTSSSGGVISGGGGGGDGDGGDYASLLLKKPKRQRVPKRGPGVAELEKILREQETNINGHVVDRDSSCRISSQFPISYHHHHHHSQSSSNSFTRNVQNISDHNHLISPPAPPHITMLYANGGKSTNVGGSSMVFPEQGLFPATTWRSSCCESSSNIYGESPKFPSGYPFSVNGSSDHMHHHHHQHFPVMLQKKPYQYSSPPTETPERPNQVSSGQGGTVLQKKPFFSLLMPEEQIREAETALTLNNERGRTRGEAIDLNLKL
ncbi:hypothetical protein Dsin_021063 [Dipteronia sinensis]|uniref:Uncharacterized protein n=1 Tax=Dipteronia sinensis TaxID=43782 RepID=A0AAE0AAE6_9ROSI|nr:hypothetical protein Dsin_021063 [Dipteronia sinensis]